MDYISGRSLGWPPNVAKKAYKKGFYIEAIQILHGWLEDQARQLIGLVGRVHYDTNSEDLWKITETFTFNQVLKILRILNQISQKEYEEFNKFNSLRNKIIHNLFKDDYYKEYLGIPQNEYDAIFKETLEECYLFTEKCELIIS